ncbi:F5/8 type C domain protein [compost metagenome]
MAKRWWMLLGVAGLGLALFVAPRGPAQADAPAVAQAYFGMQAIPKFDERLGHGAWTGSRDRGLAMHRDLGVQLSREGYIWLHDEPEQGRHPNQGDFDDAIARCAEAGIAIQLMITDTPYWASSAPLKDPSRPDTFRHAPPRNLYASIFDDGTDVPGPGKRLNPEQYWGCMLARVASRYKGKVKYYQVWNEPDFPKGVQEAAPHDLERSFTGSVQEYVRMLSIAHTVLKWQDPAARIATGGLGYADYLQAMIDHGAGAVFDALDFHAYGDPGSDGALRAFLAVSSKMRRVLRHAGLDKALICSETGFPASQPAHQADYIPKLYATGLALGLEGIIYYSNTNPSWRQMGLVDWRTMQQRTAGYWAYKTAATALSGMRFAGKLQLTPELVGYRFVAPEGAREVRVLWAPFREATAAITYHPPGRWQAVGPDGRARRLSPGEALRLSATPVLLDSDLARRYEPARPNPPRYAGRIPFREALAAASEAGGFHEPELAVDGDPDTEWVSGPLPEPSLTLALEGSHPLKGVRLKTGPMEGASLAIAVSEDGDRYRTLVSGLNFEDWGLHAVALPAPTRARWVRFTWSFPPGQAPRPVRAFAIELE